MPAVIPILLGGPLILGAGTSAFTVFAFANAALLSPLLGVALSLGLNLAVSALLKPGEPSVPTPEGGKVSLRQPVPSRRRIYGRGRYGGDYFFFLDVDGKAYQGLVIAAHEIEGFVEHWLHDEEITIDGSGVVTTPIHFVHGGSGKVTVLTRDGLASETAYSELASAFPTLWGSTHRGDGLATVLIVAETVDAAAYRTVFPQGLPGYTTVVDGLKIYDLRAAAQDADDSSTWTFKKNSALIALDYLRHESGFRLPIADIETGEFITAANVCDELITKKVGGTEARYEAAGAHRYDNAPKTVLKAITDTFDGRIYVKTNGKCGVHAGKYVPPTITISDDDILSIDVSSNTRLTETVTEQRAKYTSPDHDYSTIEALAWPWVDGETVTAGETVRNDTADMTWIQSHGQARRLMKRLYQRRNADYTSTMVVGLKGLEALDERYLMLTCEAQQIINQPVEIEDIKINLENMTVIISWRTVDANIDDWDETTEEGTAPLVPLELDKSSLAMPTNFTATNTTEVIVAGANGAYAALAWDAAASAAISHEIEYENTTASSPVERIFTVAGEVKSRTPTLADGEEYKYRIRAVGPGGAISAWTNYETETAAADTGAPAPPEDLTAAGDTPSAGETQITWNSPNSANYTGANIYRHTSNDSGAATLVTSPKISGAPSSSFSYDNTGLSADTYWYWIASVNGSGVESARTATTPASVVVT